MKSIPLTLWIYAISPLLLIVFGSLKLQAQETNEFPKDTVYLLADSLVPKQFMNMDKLAATYTAKVGYKLGWRSKTLFSRAEDLPQSYCHLNDQWKIARDEKDLRAFANSWADKKFGDSNYKVYPLYYNPVFITFLIEPQNGGYLVYPVTFLFEGLLP